MNCEHKTWYSNNPSKIIVNRSAPEADLRAAPDAALGVVET